MSSCSPARFQPHCIEQVYTSTTKVYYVCPYSTYLLPSATALRTKNTRAKQTKPLAASVSMATRSPQQPNTSTSIPPPAPVSQTLSIAPTDSKVPAQLQLASPEKGQALPIPHSPHRRKLVGTMYVCITICMMLYSEIGQCLRESSSQGIIHEFLIRRQG